MLYPWILGTEHRIGHDKNLFGRDLVGCCLTSQQTQHRGRWELYHFMVHQQRTNVLLPLQPPASRAPRRCRQRAERDMVQSPVSYDDQPLISQLGADFPKSRLLSQPPRFHIPCRPGPGAAPVLSAEHSLSRSLLDISSLGKLVAGESG